MGQRLVQTQSQRLMLTQKMQQALQILQYNALELDMHVQQELESNPLLERTVSDADVSVEPPSETSSDTHDETNNVDVEFDLDAQLSAYDQRMKEGRDFSVNHEMAARRDFYQNSITKEESFAAVLMNQAGLAFQNENRFMIAERIIGEIDDRGYFTGAR